MSDVPQEGLEFSKLSRRRMLKRIGAGAAVAWSAPVLSSLRTPAFAQYPPPHPECNEATCETFVPCSGANPDCVCVDTDRGGTCVPGSTQCAGLPLCPGGTSAECPPDHVCAVNTCCVDPVCVPIELTRACPADGAASGSRTSSGAGTLGG
jgi:hypothetical protein